MRLSSDFIRSVLPSAVMHGVFTPPGAFSIDSRTLQAGDFFIALPGRTTNGHDFVPDALERGCSGMMIDAAHAHLVAMIEKKGVCSIVVNDCQQALVELATAWRQQFSFPIIGITGSLGKTSTKNYVAAILQHFGKKYLVSPGNQNTLLGVALTLLRLDSSYDGAIFEVGISKRGEMACIAAMLKPSSALITYIGHSHMEGLGSLQDIALEKKDIFKYFKADSIGFINGDQPIIANIAYAHPTVKFGLKTVNQIQARKVVVRDGRASFVLKMYKEKYAVTLPINHAGIILNSLAAAALAHQLGVPHHLIVQALEQPVVTQGRFEQRKLKVGVGTLINDCYNASPESMKAALTSFGSLEMGAQKIAILGDMLELGADSSFWHRQLGRFLRKIPSLQRVILVGSQVHWTQKTMPSSMVVDRVATWQDALDKVKLYLAQDLPRASLILVKGSNGVGLKHIVDHLS